MNPNDLLPLKSLRLPIVAPRDTAGLSLSKVSPFPDPEDGDGYSIEWSVGDGRLTLHAASGGIGDRPPGARTERFQHPTFGDTRLEIDGDDLGTGWMSEMESGLPAYSLNGKGVPKERFLQLAQSLDYLKL